MLGEHSNENCSKTTFTPPATSHLRDLEMGVVQSCFECVDREAFQSRDNSMDGDKSRRFNHSFIDKLKFGRRFGLRGKSDRQTSESATAEANGCGDNSGICQDSTHASLHDEVVANDADLDSSKGRTLDGRLMSEKSLDADNNWEVGRNISVVSSEDIVCNDVVREEARPTSLFETSMAASANAANEDLEIDSVTIGDFCGASDPSSPDVFIGRLVNDMFRVGDLLGEGGFGSVFDGTDLRTNASVAIKIETGDDWSLEYEMDVYNALSTAQVDEHFAKVHYFGAFGSEVALVMDKFGPNVMQAFGSPPLHPRTVAQIGIEVLCRLQSLHRCGFVHGDLRPENILTNSSNPLRYHIIDFGFSMRFREQSGGQIIDQEEAEEDFFPGNICFASTTAHDWLTLSARDDIESLGYVLLFLLTGNLPWFCLPCETDEQIDVIGGAKRNAKLEELCRDSSSLMISYFEHVKALRYGSCPDYGLFRSILQRMESKV